MCLLACLLLTAAPAPPRMVTKVFCVSDLVPLAVDRPAPPLGVKVLDPAPFRDSRFAGLIRSLADITPSRPDASISYYNLSGALVVNDSPAAVAQVEARLDVWHAAQAGRQVAVQCRLVPGGFVRPTILAPDELAATLALAGHERVTVLPGLMAWNWGRATGWASGGEAVILPPLPTATPGPLVARFPSLVVRVGTQVEVQTVLSDDCRTVELTAWVQRAEWDVRPPAARRCDARHTARLPDGHTLALPVGDSAMLLTVCVQPPDPR